jgi:hypothetical protein
VLLQICTGTVDSEPPKDGGPKGDDVMNTGNKIVAGCVLAAALLGIGGGIAAAQPADPAPQPTVVNGPDIPGQPDLPEPGDVPDAAGR